MSMISVISACIYVQVYVGGGDHMVVEFTTKYAMSAYKH